MWTRAPVVGVSTFISQRDLIARIGRAAGTAIRYEQIDGEELIRRSGMRDSYGEEAFRRMIAQYTGQGFRSNSNILTWLLGRKPVSIEEYVDRVLSKDNL